MIAVATANFDLYHRAMSGLRSRGVTLTTAEPGDSLPERARILLTGPDDDLDDMGSDGDVTRVTATGNDIRRVVDEALVSLRDDGGQTVVDVDPGTGPGIAVLSDEMVITTSRVSFTGAAEAIREKTSGAVNPVVHIGNGAYLQGTKLINELDGVAVELVDETGTTPYLDSGAHGMGDVLATVSIARRDGKRIESHEIEPTEGELTRIKARSREASEDNRTIDEDLTRCVAGGELSIGEALDEHHPREE